MLTREQRERFERLRAAQATLHDWLLAEYDRDLSFPGELNDMVRLHRDRLMLIDNALPQQLPPLRGLADIAPSVSVYLAYAQELQRPLHDRIARRYRGYMGSTYISSLILDFRAALREVARIPGIVQAVDRHRAQLRRETERRGNRPIDSFSGPGIRPPIRIGELAGRFQVIRLEYGGRIIAHNIESRRESEFTIPDWMEKRRDVEASRHVLRSLQSNPILQFGYGFAEGVSGQVQGVLEVFGHLRDALNAIAQAIARLSATIRAVARQALDAIMQWGREFSGADTPRRARMAGKVLGAFFFEIITEVVTGGAMAALRTTITGLRTARGLAGVFRVVDSVSGATRAVRGVLASHFSAAARQVLVRHRLIIRTLRRQYLRTAFHVSEAVLEVAGEFVRGAIRRVAQAGETVFIFVADDGDRLMIQLGQNLDLPGDLAVWPRGGLCARP
jgi:hypothetical protein